MRSAGVTGVGVGGSSSPSPHTAGRQACASLVDLLRHRAAADPDREQYRFLDFPDGEPRVDVVTCGELDRRARALAALLQEAAAPGERAVLLCSPGAGYLAAFYACLYAGIVAVPAAAAPSERVVRRIREIARDCEPAVVLADHDILPHRSALAEDLSPLRETRWLDVDRELLGVEHLWRETPVDPGRPAYLQYTSGSTGSPKGVMVSHANALWNLETLHQGCGFDGRDQLVTWLPPYHDMGLVGHLLAALHGGFAATVMSPFDFLREPARWLVQVTQRRATCIGAPNFAFDLCVRKIPEAERAQLDLSSVRMAQCAAEPIRAGTLDRFAQAFGPCGFRREAFYTGYGLAEATLVVSLTPGGNPPLLSVGRRALRSRRVDDAPDPGDAAVLVSSGNAWGSQVRIVDPDTGLPCDPGRIGEIWVSGPSVAGGYWRRPEESRRTFRAVLERPEGQGSDSEPYLRTGDLGFLRDGELYVCGRIKDLLILRGANHYPQDIEASIEVCHPALRPGSGAAFALEVDDEERLAIVHEVRPGWDDLEEIRHRVELCVRREHGVAVHALALVEQGGLPKATSGKVARQPCRRAFLAGALPVVGQWVRGQPGAPAPSVAGD